MASVGSAGSSNSSGSDKIPSTGNFVNIPLDMFEKTQQYLTYTKYLLHGHRLWEDAETLASQCQGNCLYYAKMLFCMYKIEVGLPNNEHCKHYGYRIAQSLAKRLYIFVTL